MGLRIPSCLQEIEGVSEWHPSIDNRYRWQTLGKTVK